MAKKLAIFASGAGSNYDAIMNAIDAGSLDAEVVLLVCDRLDAKVIEKARRNQTPTFAFNPKNYPSKVAFEQEILANLLAQGVEWVILAGYMRLVGPTLLSVYKSKIINIHPSLLPAFPGKDAIGQAFRAGVKVTGVTIHFVDEGMDTGKIIDQESLRITDGESRDSLQRRVQVIEHRLYPKTIQSLIEKREGQERGA